MEVNKLQFTSQEISSLESRYRVNLINSISGFKPLNLIGSTNSSGNENLAIFNSVFHLGADPALIGFISRPNSVARHTIENIRETQKFTINSVTKRLIQRAHQTSARFPIDISEFEACNIEKIYIEGYKAPFVSESPIKIGVSFSEEIKIKQNNTILVIGEIDYLELNKDMVMDDGCLRLDNAQIVTGSSLSNYYEGLFLEKLAYAKPK